MSVQEYNFFSEVQPSQSSIFKFKKSTSIMSNQNKSFSDPKLSFETVRTFRDAVRPNTQPATIVSQLSPSVKRSQESQGPSNSGPKARKVIKASRKKKNTVPSPSCDCTDSKMIEFYKEQVSIEYTAKHKLELIVSSQSDVINSLSSTVQGIVNSCSLGLAENRFLSPKPVSMSESTSKYPDDPLLAQAHHNSLTRSEDQKSSTKKFKNLANTVQEIIDDANRGLQCVTQHTKEFIAKPIRALKKSSPTFDKKKYLNFERQLLRRKIRFSDPVSEVKVFDVSTTIQDENIEIPIEETVEETVETTTTTTTSTVVFIKTEAPDYLEKFKNSKIQQNKEPINFETFNISQEEIEYPTSWPQQWEGLSENDKKEHWRAIMKDAPTSELKTAADSYRWPTGWNLNFPTEFWQVRNISDSEKVELNENSEKII